MALKNQVRVEITQNKIFRAVVYSLDKFGYHETSINKVLKYSGISRGALTHHYGTKEAMIIETLERLLDPVRGKKVLGGKPIIKIDDITRDTKNDGKDVNLIFTKSWFNLNRHLDRLRYDRLIFLDPTTKKYTIIDGINKDEPYIPQKGDFLINIDQNGLDFLGKSLDSYDLIYSYSEKVKNGRIYRYNKCNIAD